MGFPVGRAVIVLANASRRYSVGVAEATLVAAGAPSAGAFLAPVGVRAVDAILAVVVATRGVDGAAATRVSATPKES